MKHYQINFEGQTFAQNKGYRQQEKDSKKMPINWNKVGAIGGITLGLAAILTTILVQRFNDNKNAIPNPE